jgi:hypothetical protein
MTDPVPPIDGDEGHADTIDPDDVVDPDEFPDVDEGEG